MRRLNEAGGGGRRAFLRARGEKHSPSWDNKLITSFHRWGAIMPPTFVSTRKQIMSGGTGSLHKLVDKH
ncbi:hypothetical protein NHJ13051_009719 [Beauveria bassiana]